MRDLGSNQFLVFSAQLHAMSASRARGADVFIMAVSDGHGIAVFPQPPAALAPC